MKKNALKIVTLVAVYSLPIVGILFFMKTTARDVSDKIDEVTAIEAAGPCLPGPPIEPYGEDGGGANYSN